MPHALRCWMAALLPLALAWSLPQPAAAEPRRPAVRLVVRTDDPVGAAEHLPGVAEVVEADAAARTLVVEIPPRAESATVTALAAEPATAAVERDAPARIAAVDPLLADQWGLHQASVPAVWKTTRGSPRTIIAVVDTGLRTTAADLAGARLVSGYDAVDDDGNPADPNGHGTQAAGVIAAQHNGLASAGVCPRCGLMPVRALGADGRGWQSDIARGVRWAADHGADIINLSIVARTPTGVLRDAVRYATRRGVLVVAAAGNQGSTRRTYPAAYPQVVGVAASTALDTRYSWSNSGSWIALAAPGCNWSLGTARRFCGTSAATPLVAGVAGLLRSTRSSASPGKLMAALARSTVGVRFVEHGRLQAAAALRILPQVSPVARMRLSRTRARVGPGQPTRLTGRVLDGLRLGVRRRSVTLTARRAGQRRWRTVGRATTSPAGAVRFRVRPRSTSDYRLRVLRTGVTSRRVRVRVGR